MSVWVADLHVHTHFSADAQETMENYCRCAVEQGIRIVCFTDHLDHNPTDDGYGFYRPDAYFEALERIREAFGEQLQILAGIEFAEPHVYQKELEQVARRPYDFILGSVHYAYGGVFPSVLLERKAPAERCYEAYWREVEKAVACGGFDALAHMDFLKRYFGTLLYEPEQIAGIFSRMIQNNISLEINTSSLRKGLAETLPGEAFLQLYRSSGGRFVTVGSDAHRAEDLAADGPTARRLIERLGLAEVFYRNRRRLSCGSGEVVLGTQEPAGV